MLPLLHILLILISSLSLTHANYPFSIVDKALFLSELTLPIAKKELPNLVLYLHDPNCLHCRSFNSEFNIITRTAKKAAQDLNEVNFAFADVSLESQIPKDLGITYFPAIVFFRDGKLQDQYHGPLKSKLVLNWARSQIMIPSRELKTADAQEIFGVHDIAVIQLIDYNRDVTKVMLDLWNKYRGNVNFFQSNSEVLNDVYGVGKDGENWILVVSRAGTNSTYTGEQRLKILETDLDALYKPLHPVFDQDYADIIETTPGVYYCYFTKEGQNDAVERQAFANASVILKLNQVKFCKVNVDTDLGATFARLMGIEYDKVPAVGIINTKGDVTLKYKLTEEMNQDSLVEFFEHCITKKRSLYLVKNSEDGEDKRASARGKDHIITLTRGNFKKILKEKSKPLLALYCDPSRVECREFENTYRSLAYQLRDSTEVDLARMDTSKNDIDEKIEKYPLLVFYSKENEDGLVYTGDRNIIYIKRWLRSLSIEFDD